MTRQEFIDDVEYWEDLIVFCTENGLDTCDCIYSDDDKDDYVEEQLPDLCSERDWYELRDILNGIPTGYDWYIRDTNYYIEFSGATNGDFADYKQRVLEEMDNFGTWDGEDDDEEEWIAEEEPVEEASDEFEADTDVSLNDFFASNTEDLKKIAADNAAAKAKQAADFDKYTQQYVSVSA